MMLKITLVETKFLPTEKYIKNEKQKYFFKKRFYQKLVSSKNEKTGFKRI